MQFIHPFPNNLAKNLHGNLLSLPMCLLTPDIWRLEWREGKCPGPGRGSSSKMAHRIWRCGRHHRSGPTFVNVYLCPNSRTRGQTYTWLQSSQIQPTDPWVFPRHFSIVLKVKIVSKIILRCQLAFPLYWLCTNDTKAIIVGRTWWLRVVQGPKSRSLVQGKINR